MSETASLAQAVSEADAERITAKLDVGSRMRKYAGPFGLFVAAVAFAMSVFQLYTTFFGFFDPSWIWLWEPSPACWCWSFAAER